MYKLIFLISFLITGNMDGQTINSNITGEYYLQGVMETASGFQINPDSTFQFFFSQGALDRTGKGKWEEKDGYLILNSKDKPALDFALLNSKKIENDSFTVRVIEPNQALLRYVDVYFKVDGKGKHGTTDSDGLVSFPGK
ncbi:MAG TPA: hypothetical protein VK590_04090, partial [Saprospiraceae bacterium]|nr:hypothetical protein [Saprospiraceae bacterium]